MKYKKTVLAAVLAGVLLLAGCNNDKEKEWSNTPAGANADSSTLENVNTSDTVDNTTNEDEKDSTADSTENDTSSEVQTEETEQKSPELEALRTQMANEKAISGVAFVDYVKYDLSEENVATFLYNDPLTEKYPFLKNAKTVAYNGQELFVIVPASENGIVTVYESGLDENYEHYVDNKSNPLYVGTPGEAVAVKCNDSENFTNILIKISDNGKECEIRPSISLEDGRTVVGIDGCYDFTLDDMRKYSSEAYYLLSQKFPEITNAVENGKTLVSAGLFWLSNQYMLRFELGTYTDDGFNCENRYAVSFDSTYAFDNEKQSWYIYGAGINSLKGK